MVLSFPMRTYLLPVLAVALAAHAQTPLAPTPRVAPPAAVAQEAASILKTAGVQGGIVVQLGVGDGALTAALQSNDSFQVQGLDPDLQKVEKAREAIRAAGKYGPVAVSRLSGPLLPYIDNLANLVVAEDLGAVSVKEALRILVPNGVLLLKKNGAWERTVKPKPGSLDDWTHYYYDAKGNAVSKDTEVGPPERLQWVGNPRWSRHHDRMSSVSAQVSSNGRLYYIMDEGSRISILLPSKWVLIARDAFNGTVLWKKPIQRWSDHLWPLKTGPTQLTRRLVGDGDRIFVASELEGAVNCIDGATGKLLREYPETQGVEEILYANGVLYLLVNPGKWALNDYAPKQQNDQGRVANEYEWDRKPRQLMAVHADSGKVLWKQEATCAPITLGTDGKALVFYDGTRVQCLDTATGGKLWASEQQKARKLIEYNFGPRVLIHQNVVLYAGGDGVERALDLASGKQLWEGSHEKSGYRSPEDLIVAGGLVWNAGTTQGKQTGEFTGRNPVTGEVVKQFAPDVPDGTYWFHHRCYIAKATEKFIIPSRTGIEYVDIAKQHWDLNHWVRGACLYGVMPANGLTYAGPHNCACYPEAKLDGMNALASGSGSPHPEPASDEERLEHGPAWGAPLVETDADPNDWPTYRHDPARSGFSDQPLPEGLRPVWEHGLSGRLSALSIAGGMVFVSQIDAHSLHALDHATGKPLWHFTAGARIDSPPTFWKGRVYCGGKDGWVYCLRASDGALIWRFLAAPNERRHAAWEQVESVWPVHGSVLVEKGAVNAVAGRSVFLDGGMRFVRLDAVSGKKLAEQVYNDKDPETGGDFQDRHKTLQMPVGLNDILSSDGSVLYLRSQKIREDGTRFDIGPVSGNATEQGGAQKGEGRHLFAPMGFLDDSWFHRSYWVYGKNFSGGHSGYFQAGKYTPEGRILVHDKDNVYGYAREARYYRWTTTMEHQLFSAAKDAPEAPLEQENKGGAKNAKPGQSSQIPSVRFDSENLPIANTPLTVEMWVLPDGKDGLLAQHGGGRMGYALALQDGRPGFSVRTGPGEPVTVDAQRPLDGGWHHLAGVLAEGGVLRLFVDGQLAAETKGKGLISGQPALGLQLGAPAGSQVASFGNSPYTGLIDQFAVFNRALEETEIVEHANSAAAFKASKGVILAASFDNGNARDESGRGNNGVLNGVETGKGKVAAALWFRKPATGAGKSALAASSPGGAPKANQAKGSFVEHHWEHPVPLFLRAMAMAQKTMFVAGPPDLVEEEYAFEKISQKDDSIKEQLKEQDEALDGLRGASLFPVSTASGKMGEELKLGSPPVWDGMAVAQGRLYVATVDGKVLCFGKPK
jgi:outer membrane protein assembly factor BamB